MSEVLLTLSPYIKVALPVPMRTLFDYKVPKAIALRHELKPGMRVKVPFGKSSRLGVIVALSDHSEWDPEQIKPLTSLHDKSPVISAELMALCEWAARYYHHPIGDVIFHALPILLRKGENAEFRTENWWFTTEKGQAISLEQLSRAPRQQDFLKAVQQHPNGLSQHAASVLDLAPSAAKILEEKGLLRKEPRSFNKGGERHAHVTQIPPTLNMEQMRATEHILDYRHQFHVALLDGVTGSGKTEVFYV